MFRAYKYALLPTEEQEQQLAQFFGGVRLVYNLGLECKQRAWQTDRKRVSYVELASQLTELKRTEATWLQECPAQSLQMSLRNLDRAFSNFFRGAGFPKFKSKHGRQSVQFPQNVSVDFKKKTIKLAILGDVACVFHRLFTGEIKTVTVSKTTTGKYFASILVESQDQLPEKKPVIEKTAVGIDMGISSFLTLSNGTTFENPRFLRSDLKRLRIEQRKLKRRFRKGASVQSKGYNKQRVVVSKLYERIVNRRRDYLHKISLQLIQSFDALCLEDLNLKGMMRMGPLGLSLSELGWHEFRTMLEYKADWYGKNIIYINRFAPSSKSCHQCGNIFKELRLKDRSWTCPSCGIYHSDRDLNAALNIKNFGLRSQPSTVNVSR